MISLTVNDGSHVAEARREAVAIARRHGFNDVDVGRVALVATELTTNIIKHGRGGELLIGFDNIGNGRNDIQVIALDRGPGMANVQACLADGYSSAGSAGRGLGAVVRQSTFVEIASWPKIGTAVLARIEPGKTHRGRSETAHPSYGAVSIPMPGQDVCGDAWAVDQTGATTTLLVADGLGHGPNAAEAAVEAVRLFRQFQGHNVSTLLEYINGGLRATRGAAVSVARHDGFSHRVTYGGIGNVAGGLVSNHAVRRMVSMPGTAGYNVRKIQSFEYPFESGLVILYSDGISTSWTLDRYPELGAVDPTLIAAVLYRDFGRQRDDATVLVGKLVERKLVERT
jgi:anti-sigma regulatory factor (Ser/Thr protein kinase)